VTWGVTFAPTCGANVTPWVAVEIDYWRINCAKDTTNYDIILMHKTWS